MTNDERQTLIRTLTKWSRKTTGELQRHIKRALSQALREDADAIDEESEST